MNKMKARESKSGKKVEVEELKKQLTRALADYDNLQKRVSEKKEEEEKIASFKIMVKLLPLYDMLIQAQVHLQDSGLAITIKEFETIFAEEGILKVNSKTGDVFNEKEQEAIETLEGGKKGTIAQSLLTGWKYKNGFIIRPEKVKVYKGGKK